MIDFSAVKSITIPEGVVTKIMSAGKTLWEAVRYKNWVPFSTEADGETIFNGGLGYQNGIRLSSSGETKEHVNSTVSGYIPVKPGDVIRIVGIDWGSFNTNNYMCVYDDAFNYLGAAYGRFKTYGSSATFVHDECSVLNEHDALIKLAPIGHSNAAPKIAYIRVSSVGYNVSPQDGANMIITVNEEIA